MKGPNIIEIAREAWSSGWEPDPPLLVSEWAAQKRILTKRSSDEDGLWRNERTPFLVGIMNELSPSSLTQRVIFMKCSQIGATECGNNWIGFIIDQAPGPMLMVEPSLDMVKRVVRQRIDPMIEECPSLKEKVADPGSREGANSLYIKQFPGGDLMLCGSNSAKSLRSSPIRYLFFDELDAAEGDLEGEGDPLTLAEKRTRNFSRRKIYAVSTPKLKLTSRIYREWMRSDQRRYFVPCPHCEKMQWLRWRDEDGTYRLHCDRDKRGNLIPSSAGYVCDGCGVKIEERHKSWMLSRGQWIATAPGDGKTAGFHISALYAPLGWTSWSEIVEEFLDAKDFPQKLKVFINQTLGEPYDEKRFGVDADTLKGRLEDWPRRVVPDAAAVVVQTVDVQGDRLEAKATAFGPGEESWLVDYEIFWGDPGADPTVWDRLEEWRTQRYTHASGRSMRAALTLIDRGGHHADAVDLYVMPRQREGVFALIGRQYLSRPGLAMQSQAKGSKIQLWLIATFACKDKIMSRLGMKKPGAGYMHLPEWVPDQYLDQITAEQKVPVKNKRTGAERIAYVSVGRNEALDLAVYALAGLFILRTFVNPSLYGDLQRLREALLAGGKIDTRPAKRGRRMRSAGIGR